MHIVVNTGLFKLFHWLMEQFIWYSQFENNIDIDCWKIVNRPVFVMSSLFTDNLPVYMRAFCHQVQLLIDIWWLPTLPCKIKIKLCLRCTAVCHFNLQCQYKSFWSLSVSRWVGSDSPRIGYWYVCLKGLHLFSPPELVALLVESKHSFCSGIHEKRQWALTCWWHFLDFLVRNCQVLQSLS